MMCVCRWPCGRARGDNGRGKRKGKAAGKKDAVRPGLGSPSLPTPSSAPPLAPPPLQPPFCPSMGPQARQAAAEDKRLRLGKVLLTFGE